MQRGHPAAARTCAGLERQPHALLGRRAPHHRHSHTHLQTCQCVCVCVGGGRCARRMLLACSTCVKKCAAKYAWHMGDVQLSCGASGVCIHRRCSFGVLRSAALPGRLRMPAPSQPLATRHLADLVQHEALAHNHHFHPALAVDFKHALAPAGGRGRGREPPGTLRTGRRQNFACAQDAASPGRK